MEAKQRFRVEARCSVLMRPYDTIVRADDKDEAVELARKEFGVNVTILKVEACAEVCDGQTSS